MLAVFRAEYMQCAVIWRASPTVERVYRGSKQNVGHRPGYYSRG
jgi:hypothetical protein